MRRARRFRYLIPGRLIVASKSGLRARSVKLLRGAATPSHSTGAREELLLVIRGCVDVTVTDATGSKRRVALRRGEGIFLPRATEHAVNNNTKQPALYIYVTGRA